MQSCQWWAFKFTLETSTRISVSDKPVVRFGSFFSFVKEWFEMEIQPQWLSAPDTADQCTRSAVTTRRGILLSLFFPWSLVCPSPAPLSQLLVRAHHFSMHWWSSPKEKEGNDYCVGIHILWTPVLRWSGMIYFSRAC